MLLAFACPLWAQKHRAPQSPPSLLLLRYAPPEGSEWLYEQEDSVTQEQSFLGMGGGETTTFTIARRRPLRCRVVRSADTLHLRMQLDSVALSRKFEDSALEDTAFTSSSGGIVVTYILLPSGQLLTQSEDVRDSSFLLSLERTAFARRDWLNKPLFLVRLPDTLVMPGHQWRVEEQDTLASEDENARGQSIRHLKATNTLEALVDTLGKRCARIRTAIESLTLRSTLEQRGLGTVIGDGSGQGSALAYVEVGTGMPVLVTRTLQLESTITIVGQVELLGSVTVKESSLLRRR